MALSTSLAFAACGGSDGQRKDAPEPEVAVRATLTTFAQAMARHQYATLCDRVFAPKLLQGLQSIGLPCEVAMRNSTANLQDPKLVIGKVTIDGNTAMAEIRTSAAGQKPASSVIQLTRIADEWRVSALSAGPATTPSPAGTVTVTATASPSPAPTVTPTLTPAPTGG
ncbi:MAG: hypothetical protein QOF76_3826 [Solirubrobacteraceae bacterium]|nr:hypothetical protein [Solirubrobacteraceae bacterium]